MYVKICGLRTAEHAHVAVDSGADAVGVVMNQNSPRRATEAEATAVIDAAAGRVDTVLVVNDMEAAAAAEIAVRLGFDVLQLHGPAYDENGFEAARAVIGRVWQATSLKHTPVPQVGALGAEALLLDAPRAGSGERWDLAPLTDLNLSGHWMIAGGLNPDNVAEVIAQAAPWGVDVSSGVETEPGIKSSALIEKFIAQARR